MTLNEEIQKVIGCPELEDEFFKLKKDEPNIDEVEVTLCKKDQLCNGTRASLTTF